MISVLSCSIRPERLEITNECLGRQNFKDWEWVIVTPDFLSVDRLYGHNDNVRVAQDPPKAEGDVYSLNKAMNAGIKESQGELLIRIDDSIWFPPDALSKFWFHYKNNPMSCVSGVGDQYDQLDDNGKPSHQVWIDPRKRSDLGGFYEVKPEDWETNYASFPKVLIEEIGGWDEEMDKYYAWDNVAVAYRLDKIGAKFFLDQNNESFSYQHGRNQDWNEKSWGVHDFWQWYAQRPVKLDYLG